MSPKIGPGYAIDAQFYALSNDVEKAAIRVEKWGIRAKSFPRRLLLRGSQGINATSEAPASRTLTRQPPLASLLANTDRTNAEVEQRGNRGQARCETSQEAVRHLGRPSKVYKGCLSAREQKARQDSTRRQNCG